MVARGATGDSIRAVSTPETPHDPPVRVAAIASGPFGYTDEGPRATPILALHGLPGSVRDYRWLGAALGDRARLVRLDQPGFGATPRCTAPDPTLEARARFVLDAADALGLERFVVLGHSMGGPAAIAVAARAPDRVVGLACLASVGLSPHRLARRAARLPDLARALSWPLVPRLLMPRMRADFVRMGFPRSTTDEAILQSTRIFSALSFDAIRRAARDVRCSTLIAWADDDALVEPAIALALAGVLPEGPRVSFASGGHNIQKTQAHELADALLAWTP